MLLLRSTPNVSVFCKGHTSPGYFPRGQHRSLTVALNIFLIFISMAWSSDSDMLFSSVSVAWRFSSRHFGFVVTPVWGFLRAESMALWYLLICRIRENLSALIVVVEGEVGRFVVGSSSKCRWWSLLPFWRKKESVRRGTSSLDDWGNVSAPRKCNTIYVLD